MSWLVPLTPALGETATASASDVGRVFVLGVDGGSWNLIDPMLARGELPHMAALAARGVNARLATVEPVTSPVVWTSIATGRSPENHGITDFLSSRLAIRVPTSFERLAAAGVRVGLYDYLMTWPPATLPDGFVIPGWLRRDATTTPPDVWQRIELPPYAIDYDVLRTNEDYLAMARRDVEEKAARWNQLAAAFDLQVGALTIYSIDMTSHRTWHAAFPEDFAEPQPEANAEERVAIREAVLGVDRAIGELVSTLRPEDTLIVVSDHGFRARERGTRNVWVTDPAEVLAAADLDPERDGFAVLGQFGYLAIRVHPGEVAERDALTQRLVQAFGAVRDAEGQPAYGTLEFVDVAPRPPGHERPLYQRLRQWVLRQLLERVFRVHAGEGAHAMVFARPDDDVLTAAWAGGDLRLGEERVAIGRVFSRQRFSGDHDPVAIFLAAGGPVRHVPERTDLSVLDVAPLLFHLAGQPIPDDLEGRLPSEILDPAALAARPPRTIAADQAPRLAGEGATGVEDRGVDDPALLEKLRALGYLE